MKRMIAFLLTIAMACMTLASAEISLPAGVRAIESEAFMDDASIDSVTLPKGVTSIGSRAFARSGLRQINLPDSLESISDDAFDGAPLQQVTAPQGSYAWNWAVARGYIHPDPESILLEPGEVDLEVGQSQALSAMIYPPEAAASLTWTSDAPGVASVADGMVTAVAPGTAVITATVENGVSASCDITVRLGPAQALALPQHLTEVADGAFEGDGSIAAVVVPAGCRRIGARAFAGCRGLTDVWFEAGETVIDESAFDGCGALIFHCPEGSPAADYARAKGYDIAAP